MTRRAYELSTIAQTGQCFLVSFAELIIPPQLGLDYLLLPVTVVKPAISILTERISG
jgi:hypothetical protein